MRRSKCTVSASDSAAMVLAARPEWSHRICAKSPSTGRDRPAYHRFIGHVDLRADHSTRQRETIPTSAAPGDKLADCEGDHHMDMHTYVNFAGKCEEAFRFYEKHLRGKIEVMMTHAQAPGETRVKPEWKDAVLHARISVGGTELWGADIPG